jgi:acyl-CoA hydrolase
MNLKTKKKIKTYYLAKVIEKNETITLTNANAQKSQYISKDLFRKIFKEELSVKKVKFPLFFVKNKKEVKFNVLKEKNLIFTKKEILNSFKTNSSKILQKYNSLLCPTINLLKLINYQLKKQLHNVVLIK